VSEEFEETEKRAGMSSELDEVVKSSNAVMLSSSSAMTPMKRQFGPRISLHSDSELLVELSEESEVLEVSVSLEVSESEDKSKGMLRIGRA
jgi:hypothetical protein